MYRAFEAVVSKGKITPLEKIKLKDSTRVLVTVVDDLEISDADWKKLKKWISRQRQEGKFRSYPSIEEAKQHFQRLMRS